MHPYLRSSLFALSGVLLAGIGALLYETYQIRKPPRDNPEAFARRGRDSTGQQVVVFLGASLVHGSVSANFVDRLRCRFPARDYAFVNAGVNGDLAYNVLQRLDPIIACHPDVVVVLVGTNDVQGTLSDATKRLARRSKRLPQTPSIEWYAENLQRIVAHLKERTHATIALASLPMLGEDLSSPANARICEFNAVIRRIAEGQDIAYLPVYERLTEALAGLQGNRAGRAFAGPPTLVIKAGIQHFLLGQSLDAISRRNGLALMTDLIHLNSCGAAIIADLAEAFLRAQPVRSASQRYHSASPGSGVL